MRRIDSRPTIFSKTCQEEAHASRLTSPPIQPLQLLEAVRETTEGSEPTLMNLCQVHHWPFSRRTAEIRPPDRSSRWGRRPPQGPWPPAQGPRHLSRLTCGDAPRSRPRLVHGPDIRDFGRPLAAHKRGLLGVEVFAERPIVGEGELDGMRCKFTLVGRGATR